METNRRDYYDMIDNGLREVETALDTVKNGITNIDYMVPEKSESSLYIADISFIIVAGFVGGAFSSDERIGKFLHKIHDDASRRNPEGFIGRLLHHVGDEIDKGGNFVTRRGDRPAFGFHRLFFGHDPLSISSDNPLIVMVQQYSLLSGMLQLCRHLIADTFSKQGLPLPGHSFLDYIKADGGTGNYLLSLTKELNKGSSIGNVEAFNHLFSIRTQDIIGQGLTWGIITSYIKFRNIVDKIRISQIKFSAYTISFFVNLIFGMKRTGGLPYINWTTLGMMLRESVVFFKLNYHEIKEIETRTSIIIGRNIELEERVFNTGKNIISFNTFRGYLEHIKKEESIFDDMTDYFEGK